MQALSRRVRQNASVTPTSPHLPAPSGVGDTLPGDPTLGPLAAIFRARVERWWPDLIDALEALYGTEIGAATAAELLAIAEQSYAVRPPALHARDLERTLNQGVGFVAMVPASSVDAATALLEARGIRTWAMGEVHEAATAPIEDGVEVVSGAKGVDGGSVQVVGSHPSSA